MRAVVNDKKKGLKSENLGQLQSFIGKLKKGEIKPFSEKTESARQNLKKSGVIK
jgi:hypothetical protein